MNQRSNSSSIRTPNLCATAARLSDVLLLEISRRNHIGALLPPDIFARRLPAGGSAK